MNLVVIQNRKAVTSSLVVAESFEKRHDNVMQDIKKLTTENSGVKNMFFESTYINDRGREYPMYYMNRDGFTLLAMGFTGQRAMQFKLDYIGAFNQMESELLALNKPSYEISDPIERAKKWMEEQQQLIDAQKTLEIQKPKVLFAEAVTASDDCILIGDLAKLLNNNGIKIGRNKLFQWLRENGYLQKLKNIPTQRAVDLGLFKLHESVYFKSDKSTGLSLTAKVTAKGQEYFVSKFLKFSLI